MLGYFQIGTTGYIQHVPVCASYCERWFQACRNDLTCVEDWLADFDYAEDGINSCPMNSSCLTFEQRYGNATGLCNRMWGNAFFYSEDEDNCTVMAFDGTQENPNFQLSFPIEEEEHDDDPRFKPVGTASITSGAVFKEMFAPLLYAVAVNVACIFIQLELEYV